MASRFKDRIRDSKKVFKENWRLFKQSKLGVIGLGIIIFFVLMAIFAPIIPYASERDPVMWMAPDKDIIEPQYLWGDSSNYIVNNTGYVFVNGTLETVKYPIYDEPVGLLHDGSPLDMRLGEFSKSKYLEVIYLSTGSVGKGVLGVSPVDGTPTGLPQLTANDRISSAIPVDFGPVVSSVSIYRSAIIGNASEETKEGIIFVGSTTGNVVAINARVHYETSGGGEKLFPVEYERLWLTNINGSISQSISIFYGNESNMSDDRVVVTTDNGTVCAFSLRGGNVLWTTTLNGTGFYSPISVDVGNMVVLTSRDGHFYGLNATDGTVLWNSSFNVEFSKPFMSRYYSVNADEDALVFAGTSDGYIYGIRIYDKNTTEGLKRAGEREKYLNLGKGEHQVPDIYVTPDDPETQSIYASISYLKGGQKMSTVFCIRAKDIQVEDNPYVWKNDIYGTVSQRGVYYGDQGISYFVTDEGTLYAFTNQGGIRWKSTIEEGVPLHTPFVAPTIPHSPEETQFIYAAIIATSSNGDMAALSTNGKYLAPLSPGTYPSGNTYLLGTDAMGRDIFSQLIWGSRIALIVGFGAAFFSVLTGVLVGVVSGYFGGWIDSVLMRFTDVILVMPFLPLIIVFTSLMGPSIWNIILAITLVGWPGTARIIRSQVLSLKERPFIDAARVTGASNTRIMIKHIVPNVMPLAFLYMTFAVTGAILGEASLSFIGLGDPTTMSWGMMLYSISHGSGYTLTAWWWLLPPGLAITFLVLGFFLVGRAFEEIINPRLRRRR